MAADIVNFSSIALNPFLAIFQPLLVLFHQQLFLFQLLKILVEKRARSKPVKLIMIFKQNLNQLEYSEKAIFIIIGNDHVPIIRHLFESNPYFKVEKTEDWLNEL